MNVFLNAVEWSFKNIKTTGLPRPYFNVPEKFYFRNKKRYLAKRVPIPYQSMPGEENLAIRLNIENEKYGRILADVYLEEVCINNWMIEKGYAVKYDGGTKQSPTSWTEEI
jgi:hypothetical protein